MHTTLGITPEGLPLGILDQDIYSRKELSAEKIAWKKKSHNIALPTPVTHTHSSPYPVIKINAFLVRVCDSVIVLHLGFLPIILHRLAVAMASSYTVYKI